MRISGPRRTRLVLALTIAAALAASGGAAEPPAIQVGSKAFTESYVLAEIALRALRDRGREAEHRPGMGGTIVLWRALLSGGVDAYPDYTGTIGEQILKAPATTAESDLRRALAAHGVGMTAPLGFDNTYALVVRRETAERLGLGSISDLAAHPALRVGLSHEFLARRDGWRPLAARYGLALDDVRGLEHALAYPALARGELDLIDGYSTDAKLGELDLVALEDDRRFFPRYEAVFLYRLDLDAGARGALESLSGRLDEALMIRLNATAEERNDYAAAAALFYGENVAAASAGEVARRIATWTLRHLELVALSLALAILAGVPLGIRAARPGAISQLLLGVVSTVYTVPSLALLAMLVAVPFLGISSRTAILALFLYSLLPIVRNTAAGLRSIPPEIRDSAAALGLEPRARLLKVYLPLASPTLLAGIKTSAVINVGTATLAALIGAGGLGEPILSGLNLNDAGTILQGAVPAAVLALAVQLGFEALESRLVPRGLRLSR